MLTSAYTLCMLKDCRSWTRATVERALAHANGHHCTYSDYSLAAIVVVATHTGGAAFSSSSERRRLSASVALCGTYYTIRHTPKSRAAVCDSMMSSSSSSSSAKATPRASVQERVCTSNSMSNSDNSARSGSSTGIVTATGTTAINLGND
jgi:hypothetical protein